MIFGSLKNTLLLFVAFLVFVTGLIISQVVVHRYSKSLLDGAIARAENIAQRLALEASDKILINDLVALQKMLDDQTASDSSIAYLFIVHDAQVLLHTFTDGVPLALIKANTAENSSNGHIEKIASQDGERYIDVAYPILEGTAGTLRLGMAEAAYRQQVQNLWIQMSLITVCILILSLAFSHWMINRLTLPLSQLTRYAEQIHAGNLDQEIAVRGRQEVTKLTSALNSMLMRIKDHTRRLKDSNFKLEQKNKELNRAHKQLETYFSMSQKIASLSKLEQICRFIVQTLEEVAPCRQISLLVFNNSDQTVNMATTDKTIHLNSIRYDYLYDLIHRHQKLIFIKQPEIGNLQLPQPLDTAGQIAIFPIRHHDLPIGAMTVACGSNCDCVTRELDIVSIILHQAAGAVHRANSYEEELREIKQRVNTESGFGKIIGKDPKMQVVFKLIEDVAPSDATVLIQGESGTGKELVAHAIHQRSHRADHPFVVINCAAYPSTLLESELFGHEKGAFTGAVRRKSGKFEQADGGTVFLDEIGEIDPVAQTKLLRVLQQQTIDRLGGEKPVQVNVRILAATNKILLEEVRNERFREDLYYRLNVIPIQLPPLRERSSDIHLLAQHFLERFCIEQGKTISGFRSEALRHLIESSWPGNVRELENTIEHAVVLSKGPLIELKDLPSRPTHVPVTENKEPPHTIVENESRLIRDVLDSCSWNKAQAAKKLGISRSTLYEKLKKLKIRNPTIH